MRLQFCFIMRFQLLQLLSRSHAHELLPKPPHATHFCQLIPTKYHFVFIGQCEISCSAYIPRERVGRFLALTVSLRSRTVARALRSCD